MTEKATKPEYFLRVTEKREHGYFTCEVRVCTQRFEDHQWLPYGIDDGYESGDKLSDLRIACQGDDRSQLRTDQETVYGYDKVGYHDVYRLELRDCRRMAKTLEKIERGLAKLEETRGRAKRFSEFVGRLGEVLKVKGMCHARSERERKWNDAKWEWTGLGEGVRAIENRIWQWQQEAVKRAEAQAQGSGAQAQPDEEAAS